MPDTKHQYHFEDLSPEDFERLIYWLVKRSGEFEEVQWYGGARDKGRDVVAYQHTDAGREKRYIQAKRYQRIGFATLRQELDKLAKHAKEAPDFAPDVVVFATACPVPPKAKDDAAVHARKKGLPDPYYWGRLELDEKLKGQPDTQAEFFGAPAALAILCPYQPPRRLPEFTGRVPELETLSRALEPGSETAITGLVGMGGLGKTELAKRAAQEVRARFRDGVLWAACGEWDLETVTDLWAAAYGVQLPGDDLKAKAAAWRALVDGKHALLIFDNVQSSQNLEPLLPASEVPAVLITTRDTQHPALLGAETVPLDQFTLDEAMALAAEILGQDTAQDQSAEAERLFALVGYLPLAVNVALQLARERGYPLAHLNGKLEQAGALEVLGQRERMEKSLQATFDTAYGALPEDLQETFRTLALFWKGPSFSTEALAETLALEEPEAAARLYRLAGRSLLTEEGEGRWSLYRLLRDYAAGLGPVDGTTWQRMARHYEQVIRAAHDLYLQGGGDVLRGLALFDREWPHIHAGQAWAADHAAEDDEAARLCSDYPDAGTHCLALRLHARQWIAWLEAAARAACHLGDRKSEGNHLGSLGTAYRNLGETRQAIQYYEDALAIAREIGDRRGEGNHLGNLGNAYLLLEDARQAIEYYEDALTIAREIGDRRGEGNHLGNLGNAYYSLGETRQAIEHHQQALTIAREIGDRRGEGNHLGNLGNAYAALGEIRQAIEIHQQALTIARDIGDRRGEGNTLGNLGTAHKNLGETRQAIEYYEDALAIFEAIEDPNAEKVRRLLAELDE